MRSGGRRVEIGGREVLLTNLDRPLWPEDGLTKGDLVDYLVRMAAWLLPHLEQRPLVLTRFPSGIGGESFYQKNLPAGAPDWLPTVAHQGARSERVIRYVLCDHPAALAWLGNQAAIEIHPWFSRLSDLERPDIAAFDLDPVPPAGFEECRRVALAVREVLAGFGLRAWLKTSGATGLHCYVPIEPRFGYATIARSVGHLCDAVQLLEPSLTTHVRAVSRRPAGTVYLDHLQNVMGKTLAVAYGPRPHRGAPVSAPIGWDELGAVEPRQFNLRTMPGRAGLVGDIFLAVQAERQDWSPVTRYFGGREPPEPSRRPSGTP